MGTLYLLVLWNLATQPTPVIYVYQSEDAVCEAHRYKSDASASGPYRTKVSAYKLDADFVIGKLVLKPTVVECQAPKKEMTETDFKFLLDGIEARVKALESKGRK